MMDIATEGWIQEVNSLTAENLSLYRENKRLRALNAEMLVACKEGLMVCDGNRAVNSRGMIVYAITKAEKEKS